MVICRCHSLEGFTYGEIFFALNGNYVQEHSGRAHFTPTNFVYLANFKLPPFLGVWYYVALFMALLVI